MNVHPDTLEFRELKEAINTLHMEFDVFKAVLQSDELREWQAQKVSDAIMTVDMLSAELV
jgi:hypothetical protein